MLRRFNGDYNPIFKECVWFTDIHNDRSIFIPEIGDSTLKKFDKSAKANMIDMNNYSKILYNNFKKIM